MLGDREKFVELVAQTAHNFNRYYCQCIGDSVPVQWVAATQETKDSMREAVRNMLNDTRPWNPEVNHEAWMKTRLAQGWTYGPKKDGYKKQHPNLVPYEELPEEQKYKDYLFFTIVNSFRKMFIEQIVGSHE